MVYRKRLYAMCALVTQSFIEFRVSLSGYPPCKTSKEAAR